MLRRALGSLGKATFEPTSLPRDAVTAIAIAPPVIAGLVLFRLPALAMLGVAVAVGAICQLVAWRAHVGGVGVPAVSAVIAVALLGPGSPLPWVAAAALIGAALNVILRRLAPGARLEPGLIGAAAVLLASSGRAASYFQPGSRLYGLEPIRLWEQYFIQFGQSPVDAIRLYVGNIPGPVFATSLLAVAVGAAWYWYARRLSLLVVATFVLGALLPISLFNWPVRYQLDSGPLWFVGALILADRRNLPASKAGRPLLGFAAGLLAVVPRSRGYAIEATIAEVAGLQVLLALIEGGGWMAANRARVWNQIRGAKAQPVARRQKRGYRPSSS